MHTKNISIHRREYSKDIHAVCMYIERVEYIHAKPYPDPKSYRASSGTPAPDELVVSIS
jgi:hypothetical protein